MWVTYLICKIYNSNCTVCSMKLKMIFNFIAMKYSPFWALYRRNKMFGFSRIGIWSLLFNSVSDGLNFVDWKGRRIPIVRVVNDMRLVKAKTLTPIQQAKWANRISRGCDFSECVCLLQIVRKQVASIEWRFDVEIYITLNSIQHVADLR